MLLLRVLTGSRLYGTAHANSDYDWYEVYSERIKSTHSVTSQGDLTCWSLSTFLRVAQSGGHNALDLMFCSDDWPDVDLLSDFRRSFRANPWECYKKFSSTAGRLRARGDEKGRQHAQRLEDNLNQIMLTGRYNPIWKK